MDQSKAKEGKHLKTRVNPCPPQPPRKKKKTENQRLEKSVRSINSFFKPNYERRMSPFWKYDSRKIKEL